MAETLLKYIRKIPNGHSRITKFPFQSRKNAVVVFFFLQFFFSCPETPEDKMGKNLKSYFQYRKQTAATGQQCSSLVNCQGAAFYWWI